MKWNDFFAASLPEKLLYFDFFHAPNIVIAIIVSREPTETSLEVEPSVSFQNKRHYTTGEPFRQFRQRLTIEDDCSGELVATK